MVAGRAALAGARRRARRWTTERPWFDYDPKDFNPADGQLPDRDVLAGTTTTAGLPPGPATAASCCASTGPPAARLLEGDAFSTLDGLPLAREPALDAGTPAAAGRPSASARPTGAAGRSRSRSACATCARLHPGRWRARHRRVRLFPGRSVTMIGPGVWLTTPGTHIRRGDSYSRHRLHVPSLSRAPAPRGRPRAASTAARLPIEDLQPPVRAPKASTASASRRLYIRRFRRGRPSREARLLRHALRLAPDLRAASDLARGPRGCRGASCPADAPTPYAYLRCGAGLSGGDGFRYDETPAARRPASLDGFLFDARERASASSSPAAMALLLRMGGVPARVATGFAPGSYSDRAQRYVVRDLDAHSWVEAWFPTLSAGSPSSTRRRPPPRSRSQPGDNRSELPNAGTPDGAGPRRRAPRRPREQPRARAGRGHQHAGPGSCSGSPRR